MRDGFVFEVIFNDGVLGKLNGRTQRTMVSIDMCEICVRRENEKDWNRLEVIFVAWNRRAWMSS